MTAFADAKLYELADLRARITEALEDSEGELTDDVAKALDAWEYGWPAKVQSCVLYVKDLGGDALKIQNEIERLRAKQEAIVARQKWMTDYIARCLELAGVEDGGGPLGSAKFVKNSQPKVEPLVPMDDEELRNIAMFAPQYVRHEESWSLDKKKIAEDHKAGTLDADFAKRVSITHGKHLRLK